jgi:hypothetical protein
MRIELFLLMGVVGLALAGGHWTASEADSDPNALPDPARPTRHVPGEADSDAAREFLAEVDQICCLRTAQRRQLALRLDPVCREIRRLQDQLWQQVQQVRHQRGDARDERIRLATIQRECDRLTDTRDAIVSRCLDAGQRLCWLRARLMPQVRRELAGLTFTAFQKDRLREICETVLSSLPTDAPAESVVVIRIVRQVYLEVLDARQRRQYAKIVGSRESQEMHLARSERPD